MTDYASLFTGKTGAPQAPATHLTPPKYRLLLVDDELGIVKALTRVFRQENYEVITAGSGKEALEKLAQGPVHLVISDFMMPGMNGAQFLHEVKLRSPETIRIMLTGHANTDAVMGAINEGAVYKFILKPWNDDDLRVTVALYMKEPEGEPVGISWGAPAVVAVVLTLAATLYFGLQAQGLWIQAQNSVMGLL